MLAIASANSATTGCDESMAGVAVTGGAANQDESAISLLVLSDVGDVFTDLWPVLYLQANRSWDSWVK